MVGEDSKVKVTEILCEYFCHAGLVAVKLDVADGGASLKVLGGRGGGNRPCGRFRSNLRGGLVSLVDVQDHSG